MLQSSSIPNFVNGVSQQPFSLRLPSQAEVQENGLSTAASGLKKRPPTQYLSKTALATQDLFIHTMNRDVTERYFLAIQNGDLKVFDTTGALKTVNFPEGKAYLNVTGAAAEQFAACTVADYTFIVNKSVVVQKSSVQSPTKVNEALINVKQGNYGKTYKIFLNGTLAASYTAPDGSSPSHASQISTDAIASALFSALTTNSAFPMSASKWDFKLYGSIIYMINREADFGIVTEDGFNNNAMIAIKDRVARFSDLPANARVAGFRVEVVGDTSATGDNYWVSFQPNNTTVANNAGGVWRETIAPQTLDGFVNSTLPFVLIREANGTFTFKSASWNKRTVGTVDSNPDPSFVGRTLNDVFFYRNRLGVLSDENVIFSEAGEFFNFFRTTCINSLDSDRIDVSTTHTKVNILRHALQFNKSLLLFSEQAQFTEDSPLLTPKNISLRLASEFPCYAATKPIGAGRFVYFGVNRGDWSAVREYYVDTNNVQNDAQDVTAHVPKYIPADIFKIAASTNENMLAVMSKRERNAIYVYKHYYSNNEKVQAAWSKWTFGKTDVILGMDIIESVMYLLTARGGELYFEKINLSADDIGINEPFLVHLDSKVRINPTNITFDATTGFSTITGIEYPPIAGETYQAVVTTRHSELKAGRVYPVVFQGGVKVKGDLTTAEIIFGRTYVFKYELSTITPKMQTQSGMTSVTTGRLQLRNLTINYENAGYFKVQVSIKGRETYTYPFTGKTLGVSSLIGVPTISTGKFSVPIQSQNTGARIEIINDSPIPSSFLGADWEGFYVRRSQPV